ncbi:hypothetical protein BP5796_04938 [Coleophoma crateriformis]|uniref:PH domain-containing protein n=1 Tax=Coleophoma crateriformis TaxID=565419 RepID=A0A3D8SAP3_9HELO|nr:hypothetical protein BP5796_04938 [Coleophoma crateriformis]
MTPLKDTAVLESAGSNSSSSTSHEHHVQVNPSSNRSTDSTSSSPSHPNPSRLSMEDYYVRHSMTITPLPTIPHDSPPSYESLHEVSSAASSSSSWSSLTKTSSIQPREDEGNESLPGYSSAISLEAVFSKKQELEGAVHKATDRNWSRVYVTLQGTALRFYNFTSPSVFARHQLVQKTPDLPSGTKRGVLIRSYNLQHAEVGIAADYLKRPYVIRVRAEADQFLLSCKRIETFVQWLPSLCAAIDLAPPLDEREIPKDHSVPRSGRVRRRTPRVTAPPPVSVPEESPQDTDASTPVDPLGLSPHSSSSTLATSIPTASTSTASLALVITSTAEDAQDASSSSPTPSPPPRRRPQPSHQRFILPQAPTAANPSISPTDGKWRPVHKWGPMYDMMYARRCMAILTHRSPRKSNMVIWKGTQWAVDWATGKMARLAPPDYEELGMGMGMRSASGSGSGSVVMSR